MTWQDWATVAGLPLLVVGYLELANKLGPHMASVRFPHDGRGS